MKKKLKPLPMWKTPPKTIAEAKRRVIRLLRLGWCKGWYARLNNGEHASDSDVNAARVCLVGALYRSKSSSILRDKLKTAAGMSAAGFNDRQKSVEPVIALVEKA